ncbi:MAG: response regulator [Burkholderiales bacterium]|nr:response regulator [Burkholderiales bacterium]
MAEILIVDDNKINRQLAKTLLQRDGWETAEAESGESALEILSQKVFKVILMDISMPGLSGVETLKIIRQRPSLQAIFVVAYTAHALEDERRVILDSGFDDILVKPVSKANLLNLFTPIKERLTQEAAP